MDEQKKQIQQYKFPTYRWNTYLQQTCYVPKQGLSVTTAICNESAIYTWTKTVKLTVSTILTICHVRSQWCFDLHSSLVPIAVGATWEYRTASQVSWNMKSTSPVGLSVSLVYIPPTKSILPNSVKKANKTRIKDNKWLVQRRIYLESDFQYIQVKVSHQDWPASLVHCVPICFRYTCFTHTQPPEDVYWFCPN